MLDGRWWIALVTIERDSDVQDILPDWATGASGWMVALATDEDAATERLRKNVATAGLRAIQIADMTEVFGYDEVNEFDGALASNFRDAEADAQTVWGTLFAYVGEGEA